MPTRNVVLTQHQALYLERLVASGQYQNASEVLREGLRLVEQRETEASARLAALKQAAGAGIADFEAGRFRSFDSPTALADHLASLTAEALGSALYTLHVARKGRKGRHFVLFRISARLEQPVIDVLRLLHDSMDLPEHAPGPDDAVGKAR